MNSDTSSLQKGKSASEFKSYLSWKFYWSEFNTEVGTKL